MLHSKISKKGNSQTPIRDRCKIAHKYRRFSKKNKTFHTDRYYCAHCGYQISIEDIFGKVCLCWSCNEPFEIGINQIKLFPRCYSCTHKNSSKVEIGDAKNLDWMEDKEEKSIEQISEEWMRDLGLK
jgi:hypothetical protein